MKFEKIHTDLWISERLNNGTFDYYVAISIVQTDGRNENGEWIEVLNCSASIVAPSQAREETLDSALQSSGLTLKDVGGKPNRKNAKFWVEILAEHASASFFEEIREVDFEESITDVEKELLDKAIKEAELKAGMLFGFTMDQPKNAFRATGWDLIKGNVFGKYEKKIKGGRA